ncbi:MAG: hypothetical protein K2X37_00800 [Chitinophagaceae bacterium]|nr:hypothetical protein [Chitinophagaceae bacterium]
MKRHFFLLSFLIVISSSVFAESVVMVFKDAQRKQSNIVLLFESNGQQYFFDAAKSNLQPYVFYAAGSSATIFPNEKLINHRFQVSYAYWPTDKSIRYIISIKEIGAVPSSD